MLFSLHFTTFSDIFNVKQKSINGNMFKKVIYITMGHSPQNCVITGKIQSVNFFNDIIWK